MKNFSFKKILKDINVESLLFDILLLLITGILSYSFLNNFLINRQFELYLFFTILSEVLFFVFFITLGDIAGKYKKHYPKITGWIIVFIALFLAVPVVSVSSFITEYFFITVVVIIAGFLIGFFASTKDLHKALKTTGIILFLVLLLPVVFFVVMFFIGRDKFALEYLIIIISSLIGGIVFFLILPSFLAKMIENSPKIKKVLLYTGIFLSTFLISLLSVLPENVPQITGRYAGEYRGVIYIILLSYRLLMAFIPPKNKINMVIGTITILIMIFVYG